MERVCSWLTKKDVPETLGNPVHVTFEWQQAKTLPQRLVVHMLFIPTGISRPAEGMSHLPERTTSSCNDVSK